MISSKIKDLKIRNSLKKIEKIRNVKKFLFVSMVQKNSLYKDNDRASIIISFLKDNNKIENKSKTRITNRCVLNNRGRGCSKTLRYLQNINARINAIWCHTWLL